MLEVRDLHFTYARGEFALKVAQLDLEQGQRVALLGPSGTGKTTFLRLLCGILTPETGRVSWKQQPLSRQLRLGQFGLVFQDFALLEYLTVLDNVLLPLRLSGKLVDEHQTRAKHLLERLEMRDHERHLVSRLSQGEKQRVALARALVHQPQVILADEPTSALDVRRRDLAANLLQEETEQRGALLLLVSHDEALQQQMTRQLHVEDWAV